MTGILIGIFALFWILLVAAFVASNTYQNSRPYWGPVAEIDPSNGKYIITPMYNFYQPPASVPLHNTVPTPKQIPLHNFWFGK